MMTPLCLNCSKGCSVAGSRINYVNEPGAARGLLPAWHVWNRGQNMKAIADNVWIEDSWIYVGRILLPVRMTVIRLKSGGLLLHSPLPYSRALRQELELLGRIEFLVAPSISHWMYVRQWQSAVADALTFAVPGLRARRQVRASGVRIDRELSDEPPSEWGGEIEVVLFSAPFYVESALFHSASRTLVLTDVVQNIDPAILPPALRGIARVLGNIKPSAMAPIYLRMLLRLGGKSIERAAARLLSLAPERVVFAHGDWFQKRGTEQLQHSLRWIVPSASRRRLHMLRRCVFAAAAVGAAVGGYTVIKRSRHCTAASEAQRLLLSRQVDTE
jgi:hypothetical protein